MNDEKEEMENEKEELDLDEVNKYLELFLGKSREEAIAKAVEHLANEEKIMMFSDVSFWEIPKLSTLKVIAYRYDLDWLNEYLMFNLLLRVSVNRLGRKEIVNIASGSRIGFIDRFRQFFFRKPKEEQEAYAIP
ncbi:MAG: hypothetical protein QW702_08740 [Candidatus Bathyarchaeia archaeon]